MTTCSCSVGWHLDPGPVARRRRRRPCPGHVRVPDREPTRRRRAEPTSAGSRSISYRLDRVGRSTRFPLAGDGLRRRSDAGHATMAIAALPGQSLVAGRGDARGQGGQSPTRLRSTVWHPPRDDDTTPDRENVATPSLLDLVAADTRRLAVPSRRCRPPQAG